MRTLRASFRNRNVRSAVWILLCFSLTSGVYLTWLYHLVDLVGGTWADRISMIAGYLLQAAGTGLVMYGIAKWGEGICRRFFAPSAVLLIAMCIPAAGSRSAQVVIVSGLAVNLLCGVIAGCYLYALFSYTGAKRRGTVFGFGYGLSSVLIFLLSSPGEDSFLRHPGVFAVYLVLAVLCIFLSRDLLEGRVLEEDRIHEDRIHEETAGQSVRWGKERRTILTALFAVALISFVKNLGFAFPSLDIETGMRPEIPRLFYAAGLIAAGILTDRDRRAGAVSTMAALALPFILQVAASEPVPAYLCWGIGYLFFGFFSVYRVVVFSDLGEQTALAALSPAGLMAGRAGDAAGTAICLAAGGRRMLILSVTAVSFIAAVFLLFVLYRLLYESGKTTELTEQEAFEAFAMQYGLSGREKEVLGSLLEGGSNSDIAGKLYISESTVKYHVHNILRKTGCKSRADLVARFNLFRYPNLRKAYG